jgi:hypothetical protein
MRRKPTGRIAFITAVLAFGLGTEGGGAQNRPARVVADDRGPTRLTSLPQM